ADDDFAQIASEFDTIAELRESLAGRVDQQAVFTQGTAARDKLVEELLAKVDIPVPAQLVEDQVREHLEQEGRLEDDEHRAEVTEASEKQFRTQVLLDKIVETLQQNGQLPVLVGEVARNKALAVMLGKVTVVDSAGKPVDLTGFIAVE